jgi:tape measure domain-containing protein
MSALTVTLGADISALKRGMAAASQLVAASARRMSAVSAAGLAGIGKGGAAVLESGFAAAGTAMKASIASALAGGAAAAGAGIKAVTAAAGFEQTKAAFTTMIGDAAKAEATLARLRELGAQTPFEFPELADAGRKLIAFGEGADTVPETLRRLGDVSAGVQAPIGEIAELYGKARVQGRLFAEDINQLTGRGIPIIQQLARQFGVSDSQVKKLVETGQVGFPQIEQAFIAMTSRGGQFAGMMEAQSRTTTGLFSTLRDSIGEVFLTLGTPINDALRPLIGEAIAMVQTLGPLAAEAGRKVKEAIAFVTAAFRSGQVPELVAAAMKLGFAEGVNALVSGFRTAVAFFWNLISDGAMWAGLGTILMGVAAGFGAALLEAFQTPLQYLQAGMEWAVASLLRGLLKIPGMTDLLGFDADSVETDFGKILASRRAQGADFFGMSPKDMAAQASAMVQAGTPGFSESVNRAAQKAGQEAGTDLIGTAGLRESLGRIVESISSAVTAPAEAAAAAVKDAAQNQGTAASQLPGAGTGRGMEPVVTSLGRVGGGGYQPGLLDAQRENNRLTGETNRILREMSDRLKPGPGKLVPVFG